jgi:hypothetical protein
MGQSLKTEKEASQPGPDQLERGLAGWVVLCRPEDADGIGFEGGSGQVFHGSRKICPAEASSARRKLQVFPIFAGATHLSMHAST